MLKLNYVINLLQIDTNKPGGAGSGEGVLANFFNSLLHKKTGAGSPMPKSPSKNTI